MSKPRKQICTFVAVEHGEDLQAVRFCGTSCQENRAAAKKRYPRKRLIFSKCFRA